MKESSVSKNNKLPKWIDEFISSFTKTTENETINNKIDNSIDNSIEEVEKTAEINIQNLPKIVWNDETYHVYIDEENASVINGFGNVVTSFPNVKTIDEVNQLLNDKQIVSEKIASEELEKEIDKVLAYTTTTADEIEDQQAQDYINEYNQNNPNDNTIPEDNSNDTNTNDPNVTTSSIDIEKIIDSKIEKLNNTLTNLINVKVAELQEQFYARNNFQTDISYNDIDSNDIEKFTEEASNTIQKVIQENLIDRTIPEGKYSTAENVTLDDEVELPEEEIEIFKKGICPCCNSQLAKNGSDGDYINIICSECNTEYKINANNEKIYLK